MIIKPYEANTDTLYIILGTYPNLTKLIAYSFLIFFNIPTDIAIQLKLLARAHY